MIATFAPLAALVVAFLIGFASGSFNAARKSVEHSPDEHAQGHGIGAPALGDIGAFLSNLRETATDIAAGGENVDHGGNV